jgi:hypothetical protein
MHQLFKAGDVLQIPLLDHLVFTQTIYYSFRNNKTKHYAILTNPKQTHAETYGMKKYRMEDPLCQYQMTEQINAP